MFNEPVKSGTKSFETKLLGRGAQAGEISVKGKNLAIDARPLDLIDEISHRQSLQTRLRLVPKPQHLAANARQLAKSIEGLPEAFYTESFEFRSERTSRHAFHD